MNNSTTVSIYILIVCWCSFSTLNRSGSDDAVVELLTIAASEAAIAASVDTAAIKHITSKQCYSHWRRQLWGTGARAPPPLDFQLVILGITRFTDSDENVQNNAILRNFLSIFGPFCHFLPTVFLME